MSDFATELEHEVGKLYLEACEASPKSIAAQILLRLYDAVKAARKTAESK
jgi:hypothetical protein